MIWKYTAYTALVNTSDTKKKLGYVYNNPDETKTLVSYNFKNRVFEETNILRTEKLLNQDYWLTFFVASYNGSGYHKFRVCPYHKLYTPMGYVQANELSIGEQVFMRSFGRKNNSRDFHSFMVGSLLGDGNLRLNGTFRAMHGVKQNNYCEWKSKFFDKYSSGYNKFGQFWFDANANRYLYKKYNVFYDETKSVLLPDNLYDWLDYKAIAVWYMDDGNLGGSYARWGNGRVEISVKSYNWEQINHLKYILLNKYGIECNNVSQKCISITGENAGKFFKLISAYIHPCLVYKIPPKFREDFKGFNFGEWEDIEFLDIGEIHKVTKNIIKPRERFMFNADVEKNGNFLLDDVIVQSL